MVQTSQCELPPEVEPHSEESRGLGKGLSAGFERNNVNVSSIKHLFPSRRESRGRANQLEYAVVLRKLFKDLLFSFSSLL